MKGIYLVKNGAVDEAFEVQEIEKKPLEKNQVRIKIDAFGLNYADVLARKGLYGDTPPLPCIIGYECVGYIKEVGQAVTHLNEGDRVLAFTRFGAYAQETITDSKGVIKIDDDTPIADAVALGTQFCTAYYAAYECLSLHEGSTVLVHSAAGGVGIALTQLCKAKGCKVIGTVGSDDKIEIAKKFGADYVINYRKTDFAEEALKITGKARVDAIFDAVGGKTFKKGMQILSYGGANVLFGVSSRSKGGFFSTMKVLFGMGFFTPVKLLMKSQSIIGVNMLRIGDHKPDIINLCLNKVYELYQDEIIKPHIGATFKANEIASAHALLESRNSKGKIVVEW